ncbi:hypothetical protein EDB19DRAFT_1750162, partial [Suillus lakei]
LLFIRLTTSTIYSFISSSLGYYTVYAFKFVSLLLISSLCILPSTMIRSKHFSTSTLVLVPSCFVLRVYLVY